MFWGEYLHHLDKKGRLIIPARYRPELVDGAIMTRGLDQNIIIYPHSTWATVTQQINQMSITQPGTRALRRLLFSGALEITFDKQGRVLIPNYLREYAAIETEVLVVGMENYIELWNPDCWQKALEGVSNVLANSGHLLSLNL